MADYVYPMTSAQFEVSIPGIDGNNNLGFFSYCSGFKAINKSIGTKFGDDVWNAPGNYVSVGQDYTSVVLKKGLITNDELFNKVLEGPAYSGTIRAGNIKLTVYGPGKKSRVIWTFIKAGIKAYELEGFDALHCGVVMESLTLGFKGIERKSEVMDENGNWNPAK